MGVLALCASLSGCGGGTTTATATTNVAPTANPGASQNVLVGAVVSMDGSASKDPDGGTLTFKWTLIGKPVGSAATLTNSSYPNPKFTADLAGNYVLSLVVNDGKKDSAVTSVSVTATTANAAPVANAGSNQNVTIGATVTLDGTASSDANNDSLTYKWTLQSKPSNSSATLSSLTSAKPTFKADLAGTYVATLVVSDGKANSDVAVVSVLASVANSLPVAKAGANQNVVVGTSVTLDGTASTDANGDTLVYKWSLLYKPTGSLASLASASSSKPTFTADTVGTFVVSLIVNDGQADSATVSSTTVIAEALNAAVAPTANPGASQNVLVGAVVSMDGSASKDPDGGTLTFKWTLIGKPVGSAATLTNSSYPNPKFTADLAGNYVLSLVVNDGKKDSAVTSVSVTATTANAAPVANAGSNQNVTIGATVTLDGTASSDANNDSLTYKWTLQSKPSNSSATLSSLTSAKPTFKADLAGTYVATLVVSDGKANSDVAVVSVLASVANSLPVAKAGANQNVVVGTSVTLDGTASTDANGDTLVYKWSLLYKPTGSLASLASASSSKPTFTADTVGTFVVSLIVNDGQADSATVSSTTVIAEALNAAPVANAGPAQTVLRGATVTLTGAASTDANADKLSYKWVLTTKPTGSTATLSSNSAVSPTFIADVAGVFVASLVVNDGKVDSAFSTVPISAVSTVSGLTGLSGS